MEQILILHIAIDPSKEEPTAPVKIKLRPDLAPNHVARIVELTQEGFYDGIVFHRVIPGFMAQGGDPTETGFNGSDKPNLKAEFNAEPHVRGVCSMARSGNPDSANSQFFICFGDAKFLDKQYTVWGQVIDGMDVIDALPKGEPPRKPGLIVRAEIEESGKWNPNLTAEEEVIAQKLRDEVRPLLVANATIQKHLGLDNITANDLINNSGGFKLRQMIDLNEISQMAKQGSGSFKFTLTNSAGEELDLKPLFEVD